MKTLRLLSIGALSAVILGGSLTTFADEETETNINLNQTTQGTIQFTPNTDTPEVVPPIEEPDVDIPVNPDITGPLSIVHVPTMDFGEQKISKNNEVYSMIAEKQKRKNSDEKVPYVSFAQVSDKRGTNAGWSLKVTASEFKTNDDKALNKELVGTEIHLLNSAIAYNGPDNQKPTSKGTSNEITLTANNSTEILTAAKDHGAGDTSIFWGNQAELTTTALNNDITLHVPGKSAKDAVKYTATLDWTLSDTPSNN